MLLLSLAAGSAAQQIDYAERWQASRGFEAFLESVNRRADEWRENYAAAEVETELLGRVVAARGAWRLLVIAEDWCGDPVNTVPWIARLVELAPNLDLAVAGSEVGQDVMEAHRTPDGPHLGGVARPHVRTGRARLPRLPGPPAARRRPQEPRPHRTLPRLHR